MKKIIFTALIITSGFILLESFGTKGLGKKDGTEPGYTGSPGDTLKNCTACHGGKAYNEVGWIKSNIPETGYIPGAKYRIEATGYGVTHNRFGFLISPQAISGNLLGTLELIDTVKTKLVGNNKYITYTQYGVDGMDSATWYFNWIAPTTGTGDVVFYGGFNSNQDGHKGGDITHLSTLRVKETGTASIHNLANNLNQVKVYPNPVLDVLNISFELNKSSSTKIEIIDLSGKQVEIILNESLKGLITKQINTAEFNSGIYFVKIQTEAEIITQKITVIH
ncbi:MAG: T9SS type A sorting domain-containing protein [Bacteroidia bacterium]|nr:T9SS type A sorting domain-containing protein [Bacteroidia bacterium]